MHNEKWIFKNESSTYVNEISTKNMHYNICHYIRVEESFLYNTKHEDEDYKCSYCYKIEDDRNMEFFI